MRITSKGQVTIPQEIREKAGLLPDTEVEFEYARGRVTLRAVGKPQSRARRAIQRLRGSGTNPAWKGKSTAEIMMHLRGED
jgi:AbrB family looped-hinge helix DNA binding protein